MKYKEKWIFTFEKKIDPDNCDFDFDKVYVTQFKNGNLYLSRVSENKLRFVTEGFTRYQAEIICDDMKARKIRNLDYMTFEICKSMFDR